MHFHDGEVPAAYRHYIKRKVLLTGGGLVMLMATLMVSLTFGVVRISPLELLQSLIGQPVADRVDLVLWNIRLPQALTAIVAGCGLALAGAVMQSVLKNPLGSPFTLGISHAAAFGAALSVMILDSGAMSGSSVGSLTISYPYVTTTVAFVVCLFATGVIIAISRIRGASPEIIVLTGVALGALFTAGTMFLQFFADDVQLAAMVFWTFGDVARASWRELGILSLVLAASAVYFLANSWNYNAVDTGDETAKSLGIKVERLRLIGMLVASLVTAMIVAFLGIIGFVGLVAPHMVRFVLGSDHRFMLPATVICGGLLLLGSDTVARLLLAPHLLPVSVLTAFMGAPVFIYLIVKGHRR